MRTRPSTNSPASAPGGGRDPAPESLRSRVRGLVERWARNQYELVRAAVELADSPVWRIDNAPTAAHWLADLADVATCTTREWIRVGRALARLPAIDAALAAGEISYAKARALTRIATPDTEIELLELARDTPANHLGRRLATWVRDNSDDDELDRHQQRNRSVRWRVEPDGMTVLTARLPPLYAGAVTSALTSGVTRNPPRPEGPVGLWPSLAQQYCDALHRLVTEGGGGTLTELIIHVRGDGCSLDDGTPVTGSAVERIAPGSFIRALVHDAEGHPVNASGRRRHPTTRQKRVVAERDRVCVDCGSTELLQYDHDPSWQETGRTVTDELHLRCAPCHKRRHDRSDDRQAS